MGQDCQSHINQIVVMHNSQSVAIRVGEFVISGKTCERTASDEGDLSRITYGIDLDEGINLADDVHRVHFSLHGRWHVAKIERPPSAPKFSRIFVSIPKSETDGELGGGLKGLQP